MSKSWILLGRIAFWISFPALYIYIRLGKRTRVLICVGNEFLVVKGWLGRGSWQLPGGGLHKGENSIIGALRELHEETGISLTANDLKVVAHDLVSPGSLRFRYDAYRVQLASKPLVALQPGELLDYTWLTITDIQKSITADTKQVIQITRDV